MVPNETRAHRHEFSSGQGHLLRDRVEYAELEKTRVEGHWVFKTKLEKRKGIEGYHEMVLMMAHGSSLGNGEQRQ